MVRVGFDSEDDSNGNPTMFAFVHQRGATSMERREDAIRWLWAMGEKWRGRAVVEAWATNLEYDLVNLFGPENVAQLRLQFGRSSLVGAQWRKRNVTFRDTVRHLPASVETLGELVGVEKLEKDLFNRERIPTVDELRRRCVRDARITYRFVVELVGIYRRLGERPRMTLASSAMHLWRERWWKREIYRPDEEIWSAALSAYHGGRTEVFALGEHRKVAVIDAASMFPWAMVQGEFPVPWRGWERTDQWAGPLGLYEARIDMPQGPLPRLPYRSDSGTVFPVGRWTAWYVGEELRAAAAAGARVAIRRGYVFHETARPFDDYVRTLFRRKARARGPLRAIYKTLLNCLYGKFGQQGRRVETMPLVQLEQLPESRRPARWWAWNGLAVFMLDGDPPPWGNNLWSAIVTARARQRLADEIERVRRLGGNPIYCDTDSVVFNGARLRYPAHATTPGTFELRGNYRRVEVIGKKEYALEDMRGRWTFAAKGIPERARQTYLETGAATFERPVRLREAMRAGTIPNVWRTVSKVRRVTWDQRTRLADGSLLPVLVNDD